MKIVMAGEGAIAQKHLAAIGRIDGVEVVTLAGGVAADTEAVAASGASPTGRSTSPSAWRGPASMP